jgi:hypothetical protein
VWACERNSRRGVVVVVALMNTADVVSALSDAAQPKQTNKHKKTALPAPHPCFYRVLTHNAGCALAQ